MPVELGGIEGEQYRCIATRVPDACSRARTGTGFNFILLYCYKPKRAREEGKCQTSFFYRQTDTHITDLHLHVHVHARTRFHMREIATLSKALAADPVTKDLHVFETRRNLPNKCGLANPAVSQADPCKAPSRHGYGAAIDFVPKLPGWKWLVALF